MKAVSWKDAKQVGNQILSPAYISHGYVFTSGILGTNKDGEFSPDVAQQTELAIENLLKILETSGSSIQKVLKVLIFISDPVDVSAVNKVYAKYFKHKPSRSCVAVSFPNKSVKVELECIAESNKNLSKL